MRDATALQLFIWIMTNVDRYTGEVTFGRYIVGKELRTNPNTLYSALKRLVSKYKVVTISSTTEYTTIRLIHWAKYQSGEEAVNTSDTSPSTTTHQPVNTIQEVENRELRIIHDDDHIEKIPNRLILTKGQLIAYAKEFPDLSTKEIDEQRTKCNAYMNMSSENYTNPGLFFKSWLKNHIIEKKELKRKEYKPVETPTPNISEEQRMKNMEKIAEIKRKLVSKL